VQAIKDPHKKHLLNLFLRQAASALRGAIDTNLYFADKLNQTMVIEKERLIHVNQKLQEATRAKSEFLARMSHEMRTPLNVILGLIDTVAEKIRDEEGIELVNIMKNSSSALLGIINDVLDISKIEANELKLDVERINFYPFIEQTLQVFQEKAKKKSIDLSFHIDPQVPPYVLGDSLRLRQILFNLTSNALKFTDQGRIHLNILINRKNGHIIFELSDTGIGLTEEQMVNIFEPFTQAEQGTTRNYGGTGLGLSITKRLVNLMHGDIFVRKNCKEEGGSIFFFDCELPADTRPKVRKSDKKYEEEFFKKPIKVLVVDDAIDNQLVVRLFLKKTNFQLTFANNGKEALDLYQRRKYDIVFMDMQMPVMGGNESTKEIRSFENKQNSKHTPIIAFTADAIVEHAGEMLRAGCDEVLTKPFRKEQVFDCIYRWTQTSCG